MIKKFLFAFCFLFSFFFMFLFGFDKINILAYTQYDNTLGTYPAKLDIDNYNTNNYLNINNVVTTSQGVNFDIQNNNYIITGNKTGNSYYIGTTENFILNGTYTLYRSEVWQGNFSVRNRNNDALCSLSWGQQSRTCFINDVISGIALDLTGISVGANINLNGYFMLYEGVRQSDNYYSPFKFGNRVGYQLNLYNPTSGNITTNVQIKNYDNVMVNRNVTINSNSYYEMIGNISINSSGITDTTFYLPYNISSDGSISMDYKLSINITNSNIVIKSDENIQNDSYFLFEPVFNAYYKGEPTNNLYFKNSYVFNSLMFTGMNARGQGLNSLYFNCYGNVIDNYCIYDSLTIAPNTTENVLAFNVTPTGIRNNINFNDVFIYEYTDSYGFDSTSTLFSFQLNIGDTNTSLTSGVSYDVNMGELTLLVINNNSTTSPLPNNPNTYNKYNVCDAWYDIPCQLGNAITYVIYEAPIISPVLTFIVTFITMFSSLVSFVDLFESFGIVFGCFVIYMFIELLHKYSK